MTTLLRPAILVHGALAVTAFVVALASSARWEALSQPAVPDNRPAAAPRSAASLAQDREAVEHAEAVYRTRRFAEAEDALRCAGFRNIGPSRGNRALPGKDYEVVPHPAVRHAAEVDLPRHGNGAGLCAHLQQPQVQEWYREQFRP